jgi:hypothetical protein
MASHPWGRGPVTMGGVFGDVGLRPPSRVQPLPPYFAETRAQGRSRNEVRVLGEPSASLVARGAYGLYSTDESEAATPGAGENVQIVSGRALTPR